MTVIDYDDERHIIEAVKVGGPVDPPDRPATFADVVSRTDRRPPIVPAAVRSRDGRRALLRWSAGYGGHTALYHLTRSPKYAAKVAVYAPRGVWRVTAATVWWAVGGRESFWLRQSAASKDDPHTWQQLNRTRAKESGARWWFVGAVAFVLAAAVTVAAVSGVVPRIGWYALAAGLVLLAARHGRPADRPIVDRTVESARFTKLTAEQVRTALCSVGLAAIKDPAALTFPPPGIHRDGPGWLARVNLPLGVIAVDVMERREKLASGLRLPVDQTWPAVGPDHPGQLDLWVGYLPASKMGQPAWSLASPTARTSVFELHEFGTDQRQRPVHTMLFAQNFLIGGRPGSGKSFAARTIVTIAALDPTAELKIVEYKGTGDFLDLAPLCTTYACGLADEDFTTGLAVLTWALAEAERRGARIKAAYERGEAPDRKVTPELAARPGSGLHPVVIVIDEAHELFGDPTVGKDAAAAAERLAKRGRALGLILVVCTQIPDKDSLPTGITRNIGIRWCLAVPDQVANDMILGTGAYKRGVTGTVYRPVLDAGWGVLTGLAEPAAVRSHFPDPQTAALIVARAAQLRGAVIVDQDAERVHARDMLADARACLRPGEAGVPWSVLAERLAELAPEFYTGITGDMVRESLARYDVPTQDVKVAGRNVKGARRTALDAAQHRREIESE